MSLCVCVYVRMCVCVVHVPVSVYVCMCVYTCVCIFVYICMYICVCIILCLCIYVHVCMYMCVRLSVCLCVHVCVVSVCMQARNPGKFDMYKAVVTVGELSFTTGVPASSQAKTSISVLDTENNISVTISPASSGKGEVLRWKSQAV